MDQQEKAAGAGRKVVKEKEGRQAAACEGQTWQVGVKAEGVAAELSLPVSLLEANGEPDELLLCNNSRRRRTTPIAAGTGRRGEKAGPRVLPSAGDGDAIPGTTRRSHVVPEQRMIRGCEGASDEGATSGIEGRGAKLRLRRAKRCRVEKDLPFRQLYGKHV